MQAMRDADAWDDVAAALTRMCGKTLGKYMSVAMEVASGETDLAANRLKGEAQEADSYASRKSARSDCTHNITLPSRSSFVLLSRW